MDDRTKPENLGQGNTTTSWALLHRGYHVVCADCDGGGTMMAPFVCRACVKNDATPDNPIELRSSELSDFYIHLNCYIEAIRRTQAWNKFALNSGQNCSCIDLEYNFLPEEWAQAWEAGYAAGKAERDK